MPAEKRVNPQSEARNVEAEGEVTTLDDLSGGAPAIQEVEVDPITPVAPQPQGVPMTIIRVNEDIEEMTWSANNRMESYSFQAGNRYKVPVYIAHELEAVGKLWH